MDGNDDPGSLSCHLLVHRGMDVFRQVLLSLTQDPQVEAVLAQLAEVDLAPDCWPFADTIFVVGSLTVDTLR
ncbi:MAG: hypothetical protein OHK0012_12580 [Synechococcales cyanobacterium]